MSLLTSIHGTKTFAVAVILIVVMAFLLYAGKVDTSLFSAVVFAVIGYYFGGKVAQAKSGT